MPILLTSLLFGADYQRLRYRTAIVLYLLILIIGSLPGARADIGEVASGVLLHSTAYAGLTYLLFSGSDGGRYMRACKAVLTIAAMGALDEYVQSYFPYRHASAGDWMVDCTAAVITSAVLCLLWPHLARLSARAPARA
jgi:hypothetical protein